MQASTSPYRALHPEQRQIRLLKIHPRTPPDQNIVCAMDIVSLVEKPAYNALSYMWGNQSDPKRISLDGQDFLVGQSLFDVLHQFSAEASASGEGDGTSWWIDAICINQKDDLEKSHQVAMMGDIYTSAQTVAAWLVPPSDSVIPQDVPREDAEIEFLWSDLPYRGRSQNGVFFTRVPRDRSMEMFWEIITNEYWTRIWIVQEVALGRKLGCRYGSRRFAWDNFEPLRDHWEKLREILEETMKPNYQDYIVYRRTQLFGSIASLQRPTLGTEPLKGRVPLAELVWIFMTNQSQCKMAHDHIFGFYAIAPWCCQSALKIDYSAPISQVTKSVFRHYSNVHQRSPVVEDFGVIVEVRRALDHIGGAGDLGEEFPDRYQVHDSMLSQVVQNSGFLGRAVAGKVKQRLFGGGKPSSKGIEKADSAKLRLRDMGMLMIAENF